MLLDRGTQARSHVHALQLLLLRGLNQLGDHIRRDAVYVAQVFTQCLMPSIILLAVRTVILFHRVHVHRSNVIVHGMRSVVFLRTMRTLVVGLLTARWLGVARHNVACVLGHTGRSTSTIDATVAWIGTATINRCHRIGGGYRGVVRAQLAGQ